MRASAPEFVPSELDTEDEQEQSWDDWEDDQGADSEEAQSLFDATVLPSVEAAFQYDRKQHDFDLIGLRSQHQLGDHEMIKLINFIRAEVAASRDPRPALQAISPDQPKPWQHDRYLQAVLEDDAMLMQDFEQDAAGGKEKDGRDGFEVQQLRAENAALRDALEQLRNTALEGLDLPSLAQDSGMAASSSAGSSLHRSSAAGPSRASLSQRRLTANQVIDNDYFESYGALGIHREMLSDKARTEGYRDAIMSNSDVFKGKRVLDVGCGTGILSMFAARAGATTVIGVDGSERIASLAKQVVAANNLAAEQGGPITILSGRLEALPNLPVDKVDIIVSEWMGYALLFETMLDTVLYCRDRWLVPGGLLFPCEATLYLAAAGPPGPNAGADFWNEVYGFSMQPIGDIERQRDAKVPAVAPVEAKHVISKPSLIRAFDLATLTLEQTELSEDFELELLPEQAHEPCHAFILWFDVAFPKPGHGMDGTILSTSPHEPVTHWAQTILTLRDPVESTKPKAGPAGIKGRISLARGSKHRGLDISVEYSSSAEDGRTAEHTQIFSMST